MNKFLLCLGLGTCLVLTLVCVESRAADGDIVKDFDKVSRDATTKNWDDLVKETQDFAKKYDTEQTQHLMGKRNPVNNKGGLGIGTRPGVIDPDGIEAKIIRMCRVGIPDGEMAKPDDFKKMADHLAALAAITMNQMPPKRKEDPGDVIWKKGSEKMFEKAKEFSKAIDSRDQSKIKAAARALDGTCKECHHTGPR